MELLEGDSEVRMPMGRARAWWGWEEPVEGTRHGGGVDPGGDHHSLKVSFQDNGVPGALPVALGTQSWRTSGFWPLSEALSMWGLRHGVPLSISLGRVAGGS